MLFLSSDSVGLTITGVELSFERETFASTSLWVHKGGKFTFSVRSSKRSLINLLILMCADVQPCPGPLAKQLSCSACLKTIRKNQARMQRSSCLGVLNMKCFGDEEHGVHFPKLCALPASEPISLIGSDDEYVLPLELHEFVKSRGLNLVHQNICSLMRHIDELRVIVYGLKLGMHMITLLETWLTDEISDVEIEIRGYRTYRRDRNSKGGGIVVYVREDLPLVRRSHLKSPCVEGLWLEVNLPKARGFLVGVFYRPPDSSPYHDMEFMAKFVGMLDLAVEQEREVIVTGDFNCDFFGQ